MLGWLSAQLPKRALIVSKIYALSPASVQVKKRPARAEQLKNETWSPAIIFIAGDQLPKPEKSRLLHAQRSAPKGSGKPCPHQAKDSGLISANALNRPIIFQLATKKQKRLVRYETRLGWVWVKPTGSKRKSARDFRLLCLLSLNFRSKLTI